MTDTIRVRTATPIGRIAPEIYGHFAEHLGRCIYGGLWVGDDENVETIDGVRADTLSLLSSLDPPVLRWPGGCFADDYHWEDGIGPREERPRRRSLWWAQGRDDSWEESNAFGTEEFLRVCRTVGAEPYLAANVGSGSPGEAVDWVEYCNHDGDTEYARKRVKNGHEEPHDVRYWGVGNENWGCGGRYDPDTYAQEYRRFANYLRAFERVLGERSLELVACGDNDPDWNRQFMQTLGESGAIADIGGYELLDHISVHRYYEAGEDTDFTDEQYFRLFARAKAVADDVDRAAAVLSSFVPDESVGIIVDEWGVWHPQATPANGLEQEQTVRDALTAAGVLDMLNDRADVVSMANIAQTINVLQCMVQTDEESAWATPTYRVFDLYRPHMGSKALRTDVETASRSVVDGDETTEVALVSASASRDESGVFLTLSNRDLDERTVQIAMDGNGEQTGVEARVLFEGHAPAAHTTAANAAAFESELLDVTIEADGRVGVDAPASSVVGIQFEG
ncbi:alpha-N-arabinofuranosidase [Haladaptatus sp. DYSN1]|uniref:alpha-N-arabinofuranosidase n=1 Tax=unclassified Haladaptatus TaxID=2622732 RepID=UPI00240745D6|nr:alpha-L-arabinofuranosidase C-terminal domain-containing protein [Haladaptatus sp. DYSN1]